MNLAMHVIQTDVKHVKLGLVYFLFSCFSSFCNADPVNVFISLQLPLKLNLKSNLTHSE